MFVCQNCGNVFERPRMFPVDTVESLQYIKHFPGCPACASDEYNILKFCDHCGARIDDTYIETANGQSWCSNCYKVESVRG
jgi:hypothetical protein